MQIYRKIYKLKKTSIQYKVITMAWYDKINPFHNKVADTVTKSEDDWLRKSLNDTAESLRNARYDVDPYKIVMPSVKYAECYNLVKRSDILRSTHKVVKRETFKAGLEVEPLFICKCSSCNKEFSTTVDECEECTEQGLEHTIIMPDDQQLQYAEEKILSCNVNGRPLQAELEEIEDDLNTVDEGFVYFHNDDLYRLSPLTIEPVLNQSKMLGYKEDQILLFHAKDRSKTKTIKDTEQVPAGYEQADYKASNGFYYNRREIFRINKWDSSLDKSYPIVMTLWFKSLSLLQMDSYVYKWYIGERSPKLIITFNSNDVDAIKKQFEQQDKVNRDQPNKPMIMAVPVRDGKKLMEVQDLSKSPVELESREAQDTFRRIVAGVYGVTPLYINDVQTSVGLNNESQQVSITRDALVENIERHNKILSAYSKHIGLTDWIIQVKLPAEIEFTRKYEKEKMQLELAQMKYNLGYEINYNEDSEDWETGDKRLTQDNYGDKLFNFVDEKKKMN